MIAINFHTAAIPMINIDHGDFVAKRMGERWMRREWFTAVFVSRIIFFLQGSLRFASSLPTCDRWKRSNRSLGRVTFSNIHKWLFYFNEENSSSKSEDRNVFQFIIVVPIGRRARRLLGVDEPLTETLNFSLILLHFFHQFLIAMTRSIVTCETQPNVSIRVQMTQSSTHLNRRGEFESEHRCCGCHAHRLFASLRRNQWCDLEWFSILREDDSIRSIASHFPRRNKRSAESREDQPNTFMMRIRLALVACRSLLNLFFRSAVERSRYKRWRSWAMASSEIPSFDSFVA